MPPPINTRVRKAWRRSAKGLRRVYDKSWLGRQAQRLAYAVPGQESCCPACASSRIHPVGTLALLENRAGRRVGFATVCEGCGLLFADPLPDANSVDALYARDGEYADSLYDKQAPRGFALISATELSLIFASVGPSFDVLRPGPGARALDFGCGDGRFLDALAGAGWQTFGIEPATRLAFDRHRELEVVPAEPTFRLAIANHVLEHVRDPLPVLRSLTAALEAGGLLYVSVPNLDALPDHGDFKYCLRSKVHIVAYTAACLRELFRMAGLGLAAVVEDPQLDRIQTGGVRRRLRVVGVKHPEPPSRAARAPGRAARRALRRYWWGAGWRTFLWNHVPVRLRAALENEARYRDMQRRKAMSKQ